MRHALSFTMVALLALAACNQDQNDKTSVAATEPPRAEAKTQQTAQELTPEELGELGAQIRKDPGRADALLSQHGLTKESFEAQIRKITESPEASKRYAEAYRKANA